MSREFSHPGDDAVFVRRCRIVAVAAVRLAAIFLAWRGLDQVFRLIFNVILWFTSSGYLPPLDVGTVLSVLSPILLGALLWRCSRWLAARLLPMPPARSQCPRCKYPIGEIEGDACPECGARIR